MDWTYSNSMLMMTNPAFRNTKFRLLGRESPKKNYIKNIFSSLLYNRINAHKFGYASFFQIGSILLFVLCIIFDGMICHRFPVYYLWSNATLFIQILLEHGRDQVYWSGGGVLWYTTGANDDRSLCFAANCDECTKKKLKSRKC